MELDFYTYHANIISRCLAYVEVNTADHDSCLAYLVTRSQHILDFFEIYDFPFKEFDRSTNQLQAVDVRTGEAVVIDLTKIETTMVYGDVNLISPPIIGNPIFFDILNEKDIADIQIPFCTHVKRAKEEQCFSSSYIRKKYIEVEISKFKQFITEVNLVPEDPTIAFYLNDEFHIKCNQKIWAYVSKHKEHVTFAAVAHVLRQCFIATQQETEALKTFEDVQRFFSDVPKIKKVWCDYLKQLIERQISKLNADYEEICNTHFNDTEQSRERDFIKIQYDRVITSLTNINVDNELEKFGNNVFLILRYIPQDIDMPEELKNYMFFSTHENHIIDTLYKNGVVLDEEMFDFDGLDPVWWAYGSMLGIVKNDTQSFIDQLNKSYLNEMKEVRLEQIKRHSNDIIKMVREEADELDEDDIKEIIDSMQDFESFKERLDTFTSIVDVIQYWPSVLLPLPPYVARLSGSLNHTTDLHTLIAVNS
jgi:hypothetical protein